MQYIVPWIMEKKTRQAEKKGGKTIDYRFDNRRFWLSAHDCQVPTTTSQNLDLEQQIRTCEAEQLIDCLEDWNPQFLIYR